MAADLADFWRLAIESRLLTPPQCQGFDEAFRQVKGAASQANASTLAEWLIAQNVISRYQAKVLLAGRAGPFCYGEYMVYDRVDSGRLAGVFRAVHLPTSHPVMLHFLSPSDTSDPVRWAEIVRRFGRLARLVHPGLWRCYDLVDLGRYRFVVTENLSGTACDGLLARGSLPPAEACRVGGLAADALSQLHAAGLAQVEFGPAIVWLTESSNVKMFCDPLMRGGPINFADPDPRTVATADYLAPELAQPGRAADAYSDLYGLGATLYHLAAARPPHPGGDLRQKIYRHATEPVAPLEPLGFPPVVAQVVMRLLAKDPKSRPAHAAAAAEMLAQLLDPASRVRPADQVPPTAAAMDAWLAERLAVLAQQAAAAQPASGAQAASQPAVSVLPGASVAGRSAGASAASTGGPVVAPTGGGSPATASRYRRRRSSPVGLIAMGMAGVAVLAVAMVMLLGNNSNNADATGGNDPSHAQQPPRQDNPPQVARIDKPMPPRDVTPPPPNPKEATSPIKPTNPPEPARREELVDDDGTLLWASPTWGPSLDLRCLGLGPQIVLALRPAELLANPHGDRLLAALGPGGEAFRRDVETRIGFPLEEVQQLVIAWYPNGDMPPKHSYVVQPRAVVSSTALAARWEGAEKTRYKNHDFWATESWAWLPTGDEMQTVFAAGPIEIIQEVVDQEGGRPPLAPSMGKLLAVSDADRHATLLVAPQFVFGDGRRIFGPVTEKLRLSLAELAGEQVRAMAFSLHLDGELFLEMMALEEVGAKAADLVARYERTLKNLPLEMEDRLAEMQITPYSRRLLTRFPNMLQALSINLRSGVDGDRAILRCYLPGKAAHNLALAAELAMYEGGGAAATTVASTEVKPAAGATPAERMQQVISVDLPRDTLENNLQKWALEIGVTAKILGGDLQLEGITRNQQFDLAEENKPAEQVLRAILMKASPDGKLVYVIKPEQPGGPDIVQITTLVAATRRGDPLPPGFQPPDPKKKS